MDNELFEKMFFAVIEANKGAKWESYKATVEAMFQVMAEEKIAFNFHEAKERREDRKILEESRALTEKVRNREGGKNV